MQQPPLPALEGPAALLAESALELWATEQQDALRALLANDKDTATVNAALFHLCAVALHVVVAALGRPWQYDDRVWQARLPDLRPRGRGEWNRFNTVLHSSGCLLAGLHLDWDLQQHYLRQPLWPAHIALLALLEDVAANDADLDKTTLWNDVRHALRGEHDPKA